MDKKVLKEDIADLKLNEKIAMILTIKARNGPMMKKGKKN